MRVLLANRTVWGALAAALATTASGLAATETVGPGTLEEVVRVGSTCPMFSWVEVEGARRVHVVVWELEGEGAVGGGEALPVLRQGLPGGSTAWTPSLDGCLEAGRRYAWSLRAEGWKGEEWWSEPRLFEVVDTGRAEVEAVVRAVLEGFLREGRLDRGEAEALRRVLLDGGGGAEVEEAPPRATGPIARAVPIAGDSALFGQLEAPAGLTFGVRGATSSSSAGSSGVLGESLNEALGVTYGVRGITRSKIAAAAGVLGESSSAATGAFGVQGVSPGKDGRGVRGEASGTGTTYGVEGLSSSAGGRGVRGVAESASGSSVGVLGTTVAPAGYGGLFRNTGAGGVGLFGQAGDETAADLVLGGGKGRIRSDPAAGTSALELVSNAGVLIQLNAAAPGGGSLAVVSGALTPLSVAADGTVTGGSFAGDGSLLTNVTSDDVVCAGCVSSADLAPDAVGTAQLADLAVTGGKIAAGAVASAQLAADAVSGGKIADGTITGADLAANTVGAGQIAAGAVGGPQLAGSAVTSDKIADGTITGADIAANAVGTGQIAAGAVEGTQLAADAVTSGKIADGTITGADLGPGAVGSAQLATGAVTGDKILDGTITGVDLAAGAVGTAQLAGNAVTSDKIADGAVLASDLGAGAVAGGVGGVLADNSVSTADILNGTILFEDIGQNTCDLQQIMRRSGGSWQCGTASVKRVKSASVILACGASAAFEVSCDDPSDPTDDNLRVLGGGFEETSPVLLDLSGLRVTHSYPSTDGSLWKVEATNAASGSPCPVTYTLVAWAVCG